MPIHAGAQGNLPQPGEAGMGTASIAPGWLRGAQKECDMETALVLFIVAAAFGYMGLRLYRSATSKGGCGCGCQGCKGRKPSACGTAKG